MRVAGLIIGHEILTGKFADANGPFLIERLRALGSELARLVVLEDDIEAIADEVRRCSEAFDAVVTTGGVGPTHDDVTFEGVARGLGRSLVVEPRIVALMDQAGMVLDDATLRMATVPQGTELELGDGHFPIARCANVWVFPGVPSLFRAKFSAVEPRFRGAVLHTERIRLAGRESSLAQQIHQLADTNPTVVIGSYPRYDEDVHTVLLTFESRESEDLAAAVAEARARFASSLVTD